MLPNTSGGDDYDSEEENEKQYDKSPQQEDFGIKEENEEEEKTEDFEDVAEENRRLREYLAQLKKDNIKDELREHEETIR